MNQHLDLLAAQSVARQRERDLQTTLRRREHAERRSGADLTPPPATRPHLVHDLLVRLHLVHAPVP